MAPLIPFVLVAYVLLYVFAFSIRPLPSIPNLLSASRAQKAQIPLQDTLDAWLQREEAIALDKLLANVAPGGSNVEGAAAGSVIASPSREHPNYFYQCEPAPASSLEHALLIQSCRGARCSHHDFHARRYLCRRSLLRALFEAFRHSRRLRRPPIQTAAHAEPLRSI